MVDDRAKAASPSSLRVGHLNQPVGLCLDFLTSCPILCKSLLEFSLLTCDMGVGFLNRWLTYFLLTSAHFIAMKSKMRMQTDETNGGETLWLGGCGGEV